MTKLTVLVAALLLAVACGGAGHAHSGAHGNPDSCSHTGPDGNPQAYAHFGAHGNVGPHCHAGCHRRKRPIGSGTSATLA